MLEYMIITRRFDAHRLTRAMVPIYDYSIGAKSGTTVGTGFITSARDRIQRVRVRIAPTVGGCRQADALNAVPTLLQSNPPAMQCVVQRCLPAGIHGDCDQDPR